MIQLQNDNHDRNDVLNPFSPQHPAQPEYFANRKEELNEFRSMTINSAKLKVQSPENYAILGTWGQGKTSLLYKFRQILIENLQKEIRCVCIYFPLSPQSCKSWEVFTSEFLKQVRSATYTSRLGQKIRNEIRKWEVNINLGVVEAQRKSSQESPTMLDSLQELWEKHLRPSGTQIAFILLDDLHYFPIQVEESAYLTLRTTFQELVNRKCNYSLVVTAPTLLFSEIAELAEPLGRFFKTIELESFSFANVKEAIEVRLKAVGSKTKVEDEVVESIVQKTNGHPYLVIFTMHELLNMVKDSRVIKIDSFNRAWPVIEKLISKAIFAQKYQSASQTERRLMVEIAKSGSEQVSPSEFNKFKGVSKLFSRLEKKELLIRRERGSYSLFHPLFVEYLKRQSLII